MKNNLHSEISKILEEDLGWWFDYDMVQAKDATKHLLALIKKHERELIGEDENKCVNGKPHKWITVPTDSGMETYCTKCFLNGLVPQSRNILRAEQRAKLKDPTT